MEVVEDIIKRIPKPIGEFAELYRELDEMARKIGEALIASPIYRDGVLHFGEANEEVYRALLEKAEMIPFFMMICGLSVREAERLGIPVDYGRGPRDVEAFVEFLRGCLPQRIYLETALYKFYKNWEEHQRRHRRGRRYEEVVIRFLRERGFQAGKIRINCEGVTREVDCAVPPKVGEIRVVIMVRHGVMRDLVKRAKEFSAELDMISRCLPSAKFVAVYFPAEAAEKEEIRRKLNAERERKRPYDLVVVGVDELGSLAEKLEEWGVPRK